jgi:A/G-specific adenine glycosylase
VRFEDNRDRQLLMIQQKCSATISLLDWYRKNRILYPWRRTKDPYSIWLSEILLQQTRIPVVLKYYEKILKRFPDFASLAAADESEFLSVWSGIGYYSRAKNMLKCAREVLHRYHGTFPQETQELLQLPGIGRYTAGAIRNVCFEQLTPAIDGNIGRVLARLGNIQLPMNSNEYIRKAGKQYLRLGEPPVRPSELFQALMEFGERICLPQPLCSDCPVAKSCVANRRGTAQSLPLKRGKRENKHYYWYLLLLEKDNAFYFAKNPDRGFLKDAWIFPDVFTSNALSEKQVRLQFQKIWGIHLQKAKQKQTLSHTVTFRKISVCIYEGHRYEIESNHGKWMTPRQLQEHPTSSITSKVLSVQALSRKL